MYPLTISESFGIQCADPTIRTCAGFGCAERHSPNLDVFYGLRIVPSASSPARAFARAFSAVAWG
jgi:hypothetical protein